MARRAKASPADSGPRGELVRSGAGVAPTSIADSAHTHALRLPVSSTSTSRLRTLLTESYVGRPRGLAGAAPSVASVTGAEPLAEASCVADGPANCNRPPEGASSETPADSPASAAAALLQSALAALKAGQYDRVQELVADHPPPAPEHAKAWFTIQYRVAVRAKQFTTALARLRQCLELNPLDVEVYNFMAMVYLQTQELVRARQCFEAAASLSPANEVAKSGLRKVAAVAETASVPARPAQPSGAVEPARAARELGSPGDSGGGKVAESQGHASAATLAGRNDPMGVD